MTKSTGENPNMRRQQKFLLDSSNICGSCCTALTPRLRFPLNPHPSRTQTTEESRAISPRSPLFSPQPPPNSHPNSVSNRDDRPGPKSSNPDQPSKVKPAHQGPRISDKVRAFENRTTSSEKPAGGRVASPDSGDGGGKTGGPGREEARILQGVAQKRATFKQRASSLEDNADYSQRVQSYQSKFTEELQRIKKLVGKSSLKKAYSSEQLSQKARPAGEKVEPIPPQVVQKLEARERAMRERGAGDREGKLLVKGRTRPDAGGLPASRGGTARSPVAMAPVHQLPGQLLPTAAGTSLGRCVEDVRCVLIAGLTCSFSSV